MSGQYSKNEAAYLKKVGNNIRALRTKLGISQEELAGRANLDRSYIGGVERGERNISAINLSKIAKTLGKPIGNLLKGL